MQYRFLDYCFDGTLKHHLSSCMYGTLINEEFVEFGMVGILLMVVDSFDGIDYLMTSRIMLANVT